MTRRGNEHQGVSHGTGGLFDVLGSGDLTAFHEILRASSKPTADAQHTFFGRSYFISAFELIDGKALRLKETPGAQVAQILANVGDANCYSAQGAMTNDHLIICFGLADWAGRMLLIANAAFDDFLNSEWPDSNVPPSERRMLRQLLIGQSPAQAAAADGIAYETKRTYVKLLCGRLNVSGQVELVSAVLGRLMIAINATTTDVVKDKPPSALHTYQQDFLPTCARVLQLLDGQGESVKILDIGSQSGRPVLVAHSSILPFFSEEIGTRLSKLELRLLVPLRPGIFNPQAKVLPPQDFADRVIEGLALCKSLLAGKDAPILAMSSGGNWAVRFAQQHPELAPKLVLASMMFQSKPDDTLLGGFLNGFSQMIAQRPALIGQYVDFLLSRHKSPARFRQMNDKVFPADTTDGKAMEWEFSQRGGLEAYMHFYHASPAFLKSDWHASHYVAPQDISDLHCSVHMIHGTQNERDEISTIRDLASDAPNVRLTELAGVGQVLRGPNLDAVWDLIADSN